MKIRVFYNEFREGGDICEGQEDTNWPSYEDTIIETVWLSYSGAEDLMPRADDYETLELDIPEGSPMPETVYIPVVYYRDGGTFQSTVGYKAFQGHAFLTYAEAKTALDAYAKSSKDPNDIFSGRPWEGYFAGMEDKDVVSVHYHRVISRA